ncbi:type IV pilin protein [Marinicella sediminis]|nr:type IV pilin protein [Marinicella sediminis]
MNNSGFTLIELLVAIGIVALLAAYAIPNYRDYVMKSKRTEAMNNLLQVSHLQERYYANKNRYATADELQLDEIFPTPDDTNERAYSISMESTNTSYTVQAKPHGTQTKDTDCPLFSLDSMGKRKPDNDCWD